jgi:predicted transcriptional regulator
MNFVRRSLDLDPETDALLREMAAERGQDEGKVVAEALALLDSVVDVADLDVAEDRRRLDNFLRSPEAVPLAAVKAWVESWDTPDELPPPKPQKIE